MTQYEYILVQMAAGSRAQLFNERLEHMSSEDWEPVLMSGDTTVNVLMRRPRKAAAAARPVAAAPQAQAPAPAAPVAPQQ
jgi:hypothetical protein